MRIYLTKWDYYDIFVQVRHLSYYVNFTRLAKLQRLKAFKPFKFPLSRDFWVTWLLQQTSDLTRDYRQRLRGDKNRTFSRLAVKASIFTNAFAAGKRKKKERDTRISFETTRKGKNVSVDVILRRKVPRNRNCYEDRVQFWPNNRLLNFLDYIIFESPLSGLSVDRPTSFTYAASLKRIVSFPVFLA